MNRYQLYIRSPKWRKKSKTAIKLWRGQCALFPWLKATHTHHLSYKNLENEWYFFDIIPVNESVHFDICHSRIFWKKRKKHSLRRFIGAHLFRLVALINIILRLIFFILRILIKQILKIVIKDTNNIKNKNKRKNKKQLTSKK